jgi:alcohol dehydrogenase
MSSCMVMERPGELHATEFPVPDLHPDDGLLEIEMAGVCHSDYELFKGRHAGAFPLLPGHELVGRIAAVGGWPRSAGVSRSGTGSRLSRL